MRSLCSGGLIASVPVMLTNKHLSPKMRPVFLVVWLNYASSRTRLANLQTK